MSDTLDLDQRLRELAATAPPPDVPLEEDLARGRRRLRRVRVLAGVGASAAVAVLAVGAAVVGDALSDTSGAGPAVGPSSSAPAPPSEEGPERPTRSPEDGRTGAELLQVYRDVLAEHIDPAGTHLQKKPDNLQSGGGLGTKLGWTNPGESGLGMVEIFVGDGWAGFVGGLCGDGVTCHQRDVDGVHATVSEGAGTTRVLVKRDDGSQVLIAVDLLFGNNSTVPVGEVDIAVEDLIRAAGDERLVAPSPRQIDNAGTSMGFPDLPSLPPGGTPRASRTSTDANTSPRPESARPQPR